MQPQPQEMLDVESSKAEKTPGYIGYEMRIVDDDNDDMNMREETEEANSETKVINEEVVDTKQDETRVTNVEPVLRRSSRQHKPPRWLKDFVAR